MKVNPRRYRARPLRRRANPSATTPSRTKQRLGFWTGFLLVSLGCIVAVACALVAWLQFETIFAIRAKLEVMRPWLTLVRVTVIAFLIAFWNPIAHRVVRWQRWDDQQLALFLSMRWPFSAMLIVMELLVVQNGLRHILHWVF